MRQLAVQRAFLDPPREPAMNADSQGAALNQLLLLAIERALAPPFVYRRSTFQPMRIVVVAPTLTAQTNAGESDGAVPAGFPHTLPHIAQILIRGTSQTRRRAVRGEIVSDESGRLYEKIGRQIRPLHQLASGPSGEVIDLVPFEQPRAPMIAPHTRPQPVDAPEIAKASSGPEKTGVISANFPASKFVPMHESGEQASLASHRKLFADPGQWRVLCWGDFKEVLARQLSHPERLSDTYRLPCYVQVLEVDRAVSIEELAAVYKSDNDRQAGLYFLTDEITARLDLVLPLRAAPPPNVRRAPNTLLPHERVFRLIVANDPTVDVANSNGKLDVSAATREVNTEVKPSGPALTRPSLKNTIPPRFVKDWEFKISREEASYDMNSRSGFGGLILRFFRRVRPIKLRGEFRKWQTLLAGKDADEQLWAVRPPAGALCDSSVRAWAAKTLELTGYDARKMIDEWEIFWRRKEV
jgi:hypothetical protein